MKKYIAFLVAILLAVSCTSQKEIIKPKEEPNKPIVTIEKKRSLEFEFENVRDKNNSTLRGVSVIDSLTVWASGSNGLILRTVDGGKTWNEFKIKGFETLDFRDIEAFDKNNAIVMSVDAPAFFFKTSDGGKNWKRKYMNRNPNVFFDGFAFWDSENGIAFSDPIDGKLYIVATKDGGESWREIQNMNIPSAYKNEGGFAASGTSIFVLGKELVWIGTGGSEKSRIYFSQDSGNNWRAIDSPIKASNSSSGVFSLCFKDDLNGIAVGGDYKNDKLKDNIASFSDDGGLSWMPLSNNQPNGFKSCIVWSDKYKTYITTGSSGTDYTLDDGKTWIFADKKSYNSISISKIDSSIYFVGNNGIISKLIIKEILN